MQVLPATETYMMMRENIKAHNYVAIIASVSIRSMVYAYVDILIITCDQVQLFQALQAYFSK